MTNPGVLPSVEQIDPQRFTALLEEAGWRLVGGRQGLYNRLASPTTADASGIRGSLIVPLDRQSADYQELLAAAVAEVSRSTTSDLWHRLIEPRILASAADQFQFRRETAAPAGLIPWTQGEALIKSVRGTLAAGAKAHVEKMRRFSNKLGQFSGRFLDSVYMGQTAVGSYIVTAYAPVDVEIPIYKSTGPISPGDRVARGREVTESLSSALEATVEAINFYHRHDDSLAGFDAGIEFGISHELSVSLEEFVGGAEESDINIVWENTVGLIHTDSPSTSVFRFSRRDAAVLGRAAIYLADDAEQATYETVVGRVYLASKKEAGAPGVFQMELFDGPVNKVKVRLRNDGEYYRAVRALDEDLILVVSGSLERDGTMFWLYNATIDLEASSVDEANERLGRSAPAADITLFDDPRWR